MASDVIMPQMGESIAEGTITKWLKSVGDEVERDEPLFEISTDKVDAEIPAPHAGTLSEILVGEGETVEINTVVARIGEAGVGDAVAPAAAPGPAQAAAESPTPPPATAPAAQPGPASAPSTGAASDVIMPQMGESIAEGTITKWLKSIGDEVERDEPLFEISTDKVDAEIPAPNAGTLTEILVGEGETVEINTVVARIGGTGASVAAAAAAASPTPAAAKAPVVAAPQSAASSAVSRGRAPATSREERIRTKSSPVVRKIAVEHGIDITQISGTGIHGRVTKKDILAFIESGGTTAAAPASRVVAAPQASVQMGDNYVSASSAMVGAHGYPSKTVQGYLTQVGENDRVEPMSQMRKKIAEHMVMSKAISSHVHTIYEVDMSRVDSLRKANKDQFLQASGGAKLTYTVFMVKAVVDALKAYPEVNASLLEDQIVYHGDINVGMAVALEQGLIVPVIPRAQDLSMTGIARAITDLATRARDRKLALEEIQGSTFSITNPGSFGGLIGFPVISQPNVAILGMGKVEKRVCVINDAIAIRPKMYIALGYDHRLVDGAKAEEFLSMVTNTLENFDETAL